METQNLLDVRIIEPRKKHPSIFSAFDHLSQGGVLTIINDHDPLPLYYQFKAERPDSFDWQYIEQGPEVWKVEITKTKASKTVGEIVRDNPQSASVFKKFKIDYCCHGKYSFEEACSKAGADPQEVQKAIDENSDSGSSVLRIHHWPVSLIIDYIVNNHHTYVHSAGVEMKALIDKVARVHGERHPELMNIRHYIYSLLQELENHMIKEEEILFPAIKALAVNKKVESSCNFGSVDNPISVMEMEHEEAGILLDLIKKETNNYTPPADACTSYRLVYSLLQEFENDMHQHIHLENNILFPKAQEIERSKTK